MWIFRGITAANLETDQTEMYWQAYIYVKRVQNQNWSPHHRLLSHQFNPRILDVKWSKNLVSMQQKRLIFRVAEGKNFRWAEANNCQDGCREERERWRRRRKRRKGQEPQSGRRLRHCRWYWEGAWSDHGDGVGDDEEIPSLVDVYDIAVDIGKVSGEQKGPQTIFFSSSGIQNLSFSNNLWIFDMDNDAKQYWWCWS